MTLLSDKDREAPRVLLNQAAYISFNKKLVLIKLMDLSLTGARVATTEGDLPKKFTLLWAPVSGCEPHAIECSAHWNKKGVHGIRFEKMPNLVQKVIGQLVRYHKG